MTETQSQAKKDLINLLWVILSAVLHATSLVTFSMAAHLYPGGYTGICRILVDFLKDYFNLVIPFAAPYVLLNAVTLIFVFQKIGKRFSILSLIHIILVSVFTLFFKPLSLDVHDPLLMAVFGGIMNGFAISLALTHNASSGGTDFIAIYVSSLYKKPIWNYVMIGNAFMLAIAGMLYGWETALYSIILQFCSTQIINRMHKRYSMETLMIVTSYPQEVEEAMLHCVRHGITEIHARGAYKHGENTVLYSVINSYQSGDVIRAIIKADSHAFINILETRRVIGNYYQKPLD